MIMRRHTHTGICLDCPAKHDVYNDLDYEADWRAKHNRCRNVLYLPAWLSARFLEQTFKENADVKEAFAGSETSMTVTNLHSLASSATAGWSSNSVDNSSNLYLDAHVVVHIAAVNTAPGNDQTLYLFAYGSTDGTIFTSTGTSGGTVGTEGSLTFPSIATLQQVMPILYSIPYPVQNKAIDAGPFSVRSLFGGTLPRHWGLAILNYTGMTLAASGNTVKYREIYRTVT